MEGITIILLITVLALGQCEQENVALRGEAVQSSRYGYGFAKRAIDGDRNGAYDAGSCSHTDGETNPWWRLDLLGVYRVSSVTITNRGDGFSHRIRGAEIHIGNSLENNGNDNPVCAVIFSIPAWQPVNFNCTGMVGRYINILLPGYYQFLTLCEVEVFASPVSAEYIDLTSTLGPSTSITRTEKKKKNIALRKRARQSSTKSRGVAGRAVDGNHNTWFHMGSCSQTQTESDPWWRVDLRRAYNITSVTITNRDDCCAEMIDGAELRIGNTLENNGNNNPLCTVIYSVPVWETITLECRGMEGRYVNIFLPGCHKYLTLCEVEVRGERLPVDPVTPDTKHESDSKCSHRLRVKDNLASGGISIQSTQWDQLGDADNAINRNRNGVYLQGSCSHTNAETNPWWRLDLMRSYNITSVAITNREDCCSERINGAEIHIGNSLENNGNNNPLCAVIPYIPAGQTRTYQCHGIAGRYINILLPGREKYLTLCEVEVYTHGGIYNGEKEENVALRGKATQSSQYSCLAEAKNAIDGSRNSEYRSGSCTHTKEQTDPWWRVDLPGVYTVTSVTITNRGDCCHQRINGAEIRIGSSLENNGNNNAVCAVVSIIPAGKSITFKCHGMEGRYVNVFLPGSSKILTLCEVEVKASLLENIVMDPVTSDGDTLSDRKCRVATPDNAATGGKATQSSTAYYGGAEMAIDKNRSPFYDAKTCTHTAAESNPWWRVDLLRKHIVTSVTITNREDCCASRLDGAEIRVGDSLKNNGNGNPVCAVISHINDGHPVTFQCGEMEGRYVNVFLPGRGKILTLCEVEVHGSAVLDE